jgi:hypothetical protein
MVDHHLPGRAEPLVVNYSAIVRGEKRCDVLYRYQTQNSVIADEYRAKVNAILDSLRHHHRDTSIVPILVPERPGLDADAEAQRMAVNSFETIRSLLPH